MTKEKTEISPVKIGEYWPEQGGLYGGQRCLPDGTWCALIYAAGFDCKAEWGNYGKTIKGCDCTSDGLKNTEALIKAKSPAALATKTYIADGHKDFYLPSQQDLQLLSANRLLKGVFWSSTQFSAGHAWAQSFLNGTTNLDNKTFSLGVLPVRRLKI